MDQNEQPQPGQAHALVVDDFPDSAESLKILLEHVGWSVDIASDGISALRLANANRPRLILLDISMPKLDGFDTCGVLRAQPWAADVQMIAVTGHALEDVEQRARQVGFNDFLPKPVDPEALLAIARAAALRPPAPPAP